MNIGVLNRQIVKAPAVDAESNFIRLIKYDNRRCLLRLGRLNYVCIQNLLDFLLDKLPFFLARTIPLLKLWPSVQSKVNLMHRLFYLFYFPTFLNTGTVSREILAAAVSLARVVEYHPLTFLSFLVVDRNIVT